MPIDHFQAQRFGRLEFLAKQAVEGFITGLHKSPYHGFSVEFAEHRAYNTGESTRHIDWKLYGRTDKMFVKRFEEETNLRCNIIIDRSGSMFYPKSGEKQLSKIQFAVQSAASLIYLMRKQRDAAGITLFGDGIELTTPAKSSSAHHAYLFSELEDVYDSEKGADKSTLVDTIHLMAEKASNRSLVIIFSDFMDTMFRGENEQTALYEALQHMRYNKHEVILFQMFHKSTELDLNFENRPFTFVDLETNEKVKVNPHEIQEEYHQLREAKIDEIKLRCRQYGIEWNECNVEDGIEIVLDRFLAKRKRMG